MKKEELRKEMREKRRRLTGEEIEAKSESIAQKLFASEYILNASTIMTYFSAFREVSTEKINGRLFEMNKKVAVPVSNTENETLTISYITSAERFVSGAYGIKEPQKIKECNVLDIDVIIIPGLAFDICGNRMGFGKGYYDKMLEKSSALKIGLCYDFQLLQAIPAEEHDIKMDIIITEERIIQNAF